jgi:hypothetical protein
MPNFFLETIISIVMKFTYFTRKSSTAWRLFFHNIFFIINTHIQPLHEMLYAGNIKWFPEASEFFTHAALQDIIIHKTANRSASFRGTNRWKSEGGKSGLGKDKGK